MRFIYYPLWVFAVTIGVLFASISPAFALTDPISPTQIAEGPDNPRDLFEFNGDLFFNAETSPGELGLWKFDGSQFSMVSQHIVHISHSHVEFRGELYIAGYPSLGSSITDTKLYKVTSSGLSSPIASMSFDPDQLVVFNDVLYFTGAHPNYIVQTFDGINVGTPSGFPCCLQRGVVSGNKLYFSGWHSPGSFDLYSYDGTTVTQHNTVSQIPWEIQVLNGSVYFVGIIDPTINWDRAWFRATDTSVSQISLPFQPDNRPTVQFNNQIIFAKPNSHELYGFNGTSATLFSQNYSGYGLLATSPTSVFFEGVSSSQNTQLYYSDGQTENVIPGTEFSQGIAVMGTLGSKLYFFDNDNSQWWVFDSSAKTNEPQLAVTGQNPHLFALSIGVLTVGITLLAIRRKRITFW